MKTPKLSIGLPVYNGERYLSKAIESILSQDYTDFELIISDNASTDQTSKLCERYAASDGRVIYYRNDRNLGPVVNHNRVFELARGGYFKWAAYDDECSPGMLSRLVSEMEQGGPHLALAYTQSLIIDSGEQVVGEDRVSIGSADRKAYRRLAQVVQYIGLGTPMYGVMRTSTLRKTRLIDSFKGADYVLLAELAMLGEIRHVPEVLFRKRIHPDRQIMACQTTEAYQRWLNPLATRGTGVLTVPHRLALEYARSTWRLPLSPWEKVVCTLTALWVHYDRHNEDRRKRWKARLMRVSGLRPGLLGAR